MNFLFRKDGVDMLNKSLFIGRITSEPELKETANKDLFSSFELAVQRTADIADFPKFVCYKKIAENLCKYVRKGDMIAVSARFQSRMYDGKKYNEFRVEELYFLGTKRITEEDNEDIDIPT